MTLLSQVMTALCTSASVATHAVPTHPVPVSPPMLCPPTSLVCPLNLSMISEGSLDTCWAGSWDTWPGSRACNSGDVFSRHETPQDIGGVEVAMSRK